MGISHIKKKVFFGLGYPRILTVSHPNSKLNFQNLNYLIVFVIYIPVAMGENNSKTLTLAKYFNNFYFKLKSGSTNCVSFRVGDETVGLIPASVILKLKEHSHIFVVTKDNIQFKPDINNYLLRSNAIKDILQTFRDNDDFVTLRGWRNECFEIKSSGGWSKDERTIGLFEMERSATCLFGIRQYGVDINGYVIHPEKGLCLWLQKRADNKQTWPGKLDNMVGGGLAVGYGVLETALKEASEEAGISSDLLLNLKPAGTVSFYFESERGLFPNTEFVFDLQLPIEFLPENQDGEVQSFSLVSVEDVLESVLSPEFKTTSCPVTLDFLVRHGVINSQNEPELSKLLELLHIPLKEIYEKYI